MNKTILIALLLGAAVPAAAQAPSSDAQERARIDAERARAESEFAVREQACYAKFAVNDCIEAARQARRSVLSDLRRQEVALNDAERRRRAADRVRETEARQAAQPVPGQARGQARLPAEPAATPAKPAPAGASVPNPSAPQPRATQAPADPQANARRHQERVREAQEHKERAQKKAAENTRAARPLPVPP